MGLIHYCVFFVVTALAAYITPDMLRLGRAAYSDHFTEIINRDVGEENSIAPELLTVTELSKYTGLDGSPGMYLSILGKVYDVIEGAQHYGPGSSYNFFVGRDASLAFISGEFEAKDTVENDDVLTLTPRDILGLVQWADFYATRYRFVGYLIGRFYDASGNPTEYLDQVHKQVKVAKRMREEDAKKSEQFPQCNIEWTEDAGTRVWCSTESGGKTRDWVGVPRKYFQTGGAHWRCACVKDEDLDSPSLAKFKECDVFAVSCTYNAEDEEV